MGTKTFIKHARGETPSKAFEFTKQEMLQRYGHPGRTGTILEKDSFKMVEFIGNEKELLEYIEKDFLNKFDECRCINRDANNYVFFGWAQI